jgi:glycerol-3-phosphate acyltransferase PlsY
VDQIVSKRGVRLSDEQKLDWLRLIRSDNVGPRTFRDLINHFGGAGAALKALPGLNRRGGGRGIRICSLEDAERELAAVKARGAALIAGLGAFLGHLFPIWLRFKGGKGVATYIGVLLALAWPIALFFGAVWLAMAALFRYSSLASLTASALTAPALWFYGEPRTAGLFLLLTTLLWVMHRANIARLLKGSEGKIGRR